MALWKEGSNILCSELRYRQNYAIRKRGSPCFPIHCIGTPATHFLLLLVLFLYLRIRKNILPSSSTNFEFSFTETESL